MKNKQIFVVVSFVLAVLLSITPSARALEVVVSGNGSESVSEVVVETITENVISQENTANIENNVEIDANTGDNSADGNTGGEVNIDTGSITETVQIETVANVSSVETACCETESDFSITDNGSNTDNTIDVNSTNTTEVSITQEANIENNVEGFANTGGNSASNNSGEVTIKTGEINVQGGITNGPVNVMSISGGSGGENMSVNISGNGSDSVNNISLDFSDNNKLSINHQADIQNNVGWNLNTGNNEADDNNGDVEILTGDIFLDFFINNGPINIGGIDWGCCDIFDPSDPGDPGDPDDPSDPNDPSDPGDPGVGGNSGGSGNGSSGSSSSGLSDNNSVGGMVLGLSDTSSEQAQNMIFWVGIAMILMGIKIVGEELTKKKLHFYGNREE